MSSPQTLPSQRLRLMGPAGVYSPVEYFEAVSELAAAATERAGGAEELFYRVAGQTLCLRFAGPALVPKLTPALAHLSCAPVADPSLTVTLWDSASTSTGMIPPPWQPGELRVCGEVGSFIKEGYYTHYNVYHNALTLFDRADRQAIYWLSSFEDVPEHETVSPLFTLFHAWLGRKGIHHVHAGAVGYPDGGVLVVGQSGAGKSNTGLACLNSDLLYAGDDRCLVAADPTPAVYSLYQTAKTHPQDIHRFPQLAAHADSVPHLPSGKAIYYLNELLPGKLSSGFPLRAIVMPVVTGRRDTEIGPGSAADGLRLLAPDPLFRWPSLGAKTFRDLSNVFRRVPCYRLYVGLEREQIPAAIAGLLRHG